MDLVQHAFRNSAHFPLGSLELKLVPLSPIALSFPRPVACSEIYAHRRGVQIQFLLMLLCNVKLKIKASVLCHDPWQGFICLGAPSSEGLCYLACNV